MYRDENEFKSAAAKLLESVEQQERGELTEAELLVRWKRFMRCADRYLRSIDSN